MLKSCRREVYLGFILPTFSCKTHNTFYSEPDKHVITVEDGSKPYRATLILDRKAWRWGVDILENTLNDTAKYGICRIPPGKTGNLFSVDW